MLSYSCYKIIQLNNFCLDPITKRTQHLDLVLSLVLFSKTRGLHHTDPRVYATLVSKSGKSSKRPKRRLHLKKQFTVVVLVQAASMTERGRVSQRWPRVSSSVEFFYSLKHTCMNAIHTHESKFVPFGFRKLGFPSFCSTNSLQIVEFLLGVTFSFGVIY